MYHPNSNLISHYITDGPTPLHNCANQLLKKALLLNFSVITSTGITLAVLSIRVSDQLRMTLPWADPPEWWLIVGLSTRHNLKSNA